MPLTLSPLCTASIDKPIRWSHVPMTTSESMHEAVPFGIGCKGDNLRGGGLTE